jgi:hypothetical protein
MGWMAVLRALGALRSGRLIREIAGLRQAAEALVALKAMELQVPNPLSAGLRRDAKGKPPAVDIVDTPIGDYVEAEQRREDYRARAGKPASFDQDFMGAPPEDAAGDAAARGQRAIVYPEDFPPPAALLRDRLEHTE